MKMTINTLGNARSASGPRGKGGRARKRGAHRATAGTVRKQKGRCAARRASSSAAPLPPGAADARPHDPWSWFPVFVGFEFGG
jgi:hypothetical protein